MSNSRRNFLKKASILAMPVVTISNSSYAADCCDKPVRWDKECDVVVLGAGGAGLHAAIQAHDAGGGWSYAINLQIHIFLLQHFVEVYFRLLIAENSAMKTFMMLLKSLLKICCNTAAIGQILICCVRTHVILELFLIG